MMKTILRMAGTAAAALALSLALALATAGAQSAGPDSSTAVIEAHEAASDEFDPGKNERLIALSKNLRCLVCQNQTIADSNADLAIDLRRQVRQLIAQGKTDDEIIQFMTDRYGDFVLYNPPFTAATAILWVGPLALLLVVLGWYFTTMRRQAASKAAEARPLTESEVAEAERLLGLRAPEPPKASPSGWRARRRK